MEFKAYAYLRCEKSVQFTSSLTKHIKACKILIILPNWQPFKVVTILEYNTTNHIDLALDNFKEDINLRKSNHDEEKNQPADINNDKKNMIPINIDK